MNCKIVCVQNKIFSFSHYFATKTFLLIHISSVPIRISFSHYFATKPLVQIRVFFSQYVTTKPLVQIRISNYFATKSLPLFAPF